MKLARNVLSGREVAVKITDKTQLNPTSAKQLFEEIRTMKTLRHPDTVKWLDIIETEKDPLFSHGAREWG